MFESRKKPTTMGPTRKRKNTYIIHLDNMLMDMSLFQACDTTPLAVVVKNGQQVQKSNGGWMTSTMFPNPSASYLATEYFAMKPIMGKLARTIVEYLDKETGKPVVAVYPQSVCIYDGYDVSNFKSHLNHASRRDFDYQLNLRKHLLEMADQNTRK